MNNVPKSHTCCLGAASSALACKRQTEGGKGRVRARDGSRGHQAEAFFLAMGQGGLTFQPKASQGSPTQI